MRGQEKKMRRRRKRGRVEARKAAQEGRSLGRRVPLDSKV